MKRSGVRRSRNVERPPEGLRGVDALEELIEGLGLAAAGNRPVAARLVRCARSLDEPRREESDSRRIDARHEDETPRPPVSGPVEGVEPGADSGERPAAGRIFHRPLDARGYVHRVRCDDDDLSGARATNCVEDAVEKAPSDVEVRLRGAAEPKAPPAREDDRVELFGAGRANVQGGHRLPRIGGRGRSRIAHVAHCARQDGGEHMTLLVQKRFLVRPRA